MRKLVAAALLAVCITPALAQAAPREPVVSAPSAPMGAQSGEGVRIAMRQQTLAPGAKLDEHRQEGERYVFVVSGQLKVSNLVTGDEQVVEGGKMAAEQPGDWYVAEVIGNAPATFYLIDRAPAADSPTVAGGN